MESAKALREQRALLAAQISALQSENKAVDAAGNFTEAWLKVNADYNALSKRIEAAETVARITAEQKEVADWRASIGREDRVAEPRPGRIESQSQLDGYRALALKAWFQTQQGEYLDDATVEACRAIRFNPNVRQLNVPMYSTSDYRSLQNRFRAAHHSAALENLRGFSAPDYKAVLSMGSGPKGGYLVPPESLIRELELNMLWYGGMRQTAETIRTESGERMSWPTADDTFNAGIQLGEASAAMPSGGGPTATSVDPTFAKVYWDAYKFSSQPILVPYELIQDSAFNLPALIGAMFGIRLGRITNTKFTVGTGAATPMGLVSKLVQLGQDTLSYPTGYAKGYIQSAKAGSFVYDDIFKLEHSVDKAYRVNPGFMCHDQILLYVRLFKDGIGRPLWQSNIREGMPDTFDGYPLTTNNDMDNTVASGKNVLAWGELSKYKIRTVGMMRFYRLEERYRDTDQDGFIGLIREDGNLLISGNAPVKLLQVQ